MTFLASSGWPQDVGGAVSLTYDDSLPCHFEYVAGLLEAAGLRGTFNVITGRSGFLDFAARWRDVAGRGHELGNHTVFHPCRSEPTDPRQLHDSSYNMCCYTERRFRDELCVANWMLEQVDGRKRRTYANTCYHTAIGLGETQQRIEPILADYFVAARGERSNRAVDPARFDPQNLGTVSADRRTFEDLRAEIETAVGNGQWIIYTIHGVGEGTHNHYIDVEEHRRLVEWLGANRPRIWTAPMLEIAAYLIG